MSPLVVTIAWLTFVIIGLVAMTIGVLRAWLRASRALSRQVQKRLEDRSNPNVCRCGYPLIGLDAARGPECGRVIGFNATPEGLGLTHQQLQRVQAKRRRNGNGGSCHARRYCR